MRCFRASALMRSNCPLENQRHRFESRVRMWPVHGAVGEVEMVVGEHDERIVEREIVRRDDLRRQMARTTNPGPSGGTATRRTMER